MSLFSAKSFRELVSGQRRGAGASLLRAALTMAELPYILAVRYRNRGYDLGRTSTHHVEVPVISVGNLTLGGTGKEEEDRHPKVRRGVLIGVGAKILGNIEIGQYSRIGAGSVVIKPVPPHTTVAGVPARVIGSADSECPSQDMDHRLSGWETYDPSI